MCGNIIAFLCVVIFNVVYAASEFPNHFRRCPIKDDSCLNKAIEGALHYLCKNGLPEYNIPKLDPIEIPEINIGTKGSAVEVLQKYTDVKVTGFSNATVSKTRLNWDKKSLSFVTSAPKFDQISDYDVRGRLLIFPIFGNGKSVLTQTKVAVLHKIQFEERTKDGKTYWKVISYDVHMKPEKIAFHFDNLFNGNKILSERLHEVVNENWQPLWNESKQDFEKVYGNFYKEFSTKFFQNVPIDNIFQL